jgi:hypothetical protein
MAESLDLRQTASGKEEEDCILDNLKHIDKFMAAVKTRTGSISTKTRDELLRLKANFDIAVMALEEQQNEEDRASKGAIPNKRYKKTSESSRNTDTDSTSNPTDTLSETTSSEDDTPSKKTSKPQPKMKQRRQGDTFTQLIRALSKLDMRKTPAFSNFDEDSGMGLKEYLRMFETYCRENFKGMQLFWIGELEAKLNGETLRAFKSVRSVDDTYDSLTRKLVKWYDNEKLARRNKTRSNFVKAKYINGESFYLLATRLEKLFSVAFPKKDTQTSKTLREKFISLLPSNAKGIVRNQVMNRRMENRKMRWDDLKKFASLCDVERNGEVKTTDTENIIINVGLSNKQGSSARWKSAKPDNQMRDRRNFIRPPQQLMDRNTTCAHCGRIGHVEANCRKKLDLCFSCGSPDHFLYNCPRNFRRRPQNQMYNPQPHASNYQTRTEFNRNPQRYSSQQDLRRPQVASHPQQRRLSGN